MSGVPAVIATDFARPPEGGRIGRYRLFRPLASGGMATVYVGWLESDEGFRRPIAAKVMHPVASEDERRSAMVLSEARIASRIRHPNVVSVVDVVSSEYGPVLIMEYVNGVSLSHLLDAAAYDVPWPIVSRIAVDTLEGLHAAHEVTNEAGLPLGVVHRDVSPQNILVDDTGSGRLVDFGVAKALERGYTTASGEVHGKLAYMAPEQFHSIGVDRRVDVWGFGMVLWQLLAGRRPFFGLDTAPMLRSILAGEIASPKVYRPCPEELVRICMRALSLSPDARFETARLMALEIERAVPPASAREVAQWVKKKSAAALAVRATLLSEMEQVAQRMRSGIVEVPPSQPVLDARPSATSAFAPTVAHPNAAPGTFETAPRSRSGLPFALAASVFVLVGLAFGGRALYRARHAAPPPPAASPVESAAAPVTSTMPLAATTPATTDALALPSPPATGAPSASHARPAGPRPGSRPSTQPRSGTTAKPPAEDDPLGRNQRN